MARTDLKIYSKIAATGKNTTTNITHVNTEATSDQLKGLATRLNAFTTNEYQQADRVNTINVDTEQVPASGKTAPTLTVGDRYSSGSPDYDACFPITYDGDGTIESLVVGSLTGTANNTFANLGVYENGVVKIKGRFTDTFAKVVITATETDNYGSAGITITNSTPPQ